MGTRFGFEAKLLRGASGSTGDTEVKQVKDLTLNLEADESDVTTRASGGWKNVVEGLLDGSIEFGIPNDPSNADYQAFLNAFLNKSAIALFVTDGAGSGLDADFAITKFGIDQALSSRQSVSVTAKPTESTRVPKWVTGSTGSGE